MDAPARRDVLNEMRGHIQEEVADLMEQGYTEEEAVRIASESFGTLDNLVQELNEVHNHSNWVQTLIAALPHLIFALLFALHLWSNMAWLVIILICTVGVTIYGWHHNKPTWLFTWLGYALIPLLIVGIFLLEQASKADTMIPSWLAWPLMIVYFPVILWFFLHIMIQVLRRDWLLGSLMALPVPPIVGWLMTAPWKSELLGAGTPALQSLEPWVALSFLTLAGIVALFTRLKQRPLKVGVLLLSGLTFLFIITFSTGGSVGIMTLVIVGFMAVLLLILPALLEQRLARAEVEPWHGPLESDLELKS